MALSIKSDEADRLARALVSETGETLTGAVVEALKERLERERAKKGAGIAARLERLASDVGRLGTVDTRMPDEIIDYDEVGLPR